MDSTTKHTSVFNSQPEIILQNFRIDNKKDDNLFLTENQIDNLLENYNNKKDKSIDNKILYISLLILFLLLFLFYFF